MIKETQLQEEIIAFDLAIYMQSYARSGTNQKVLWKIKDTLLQEMTGSFSEILCIIWILKVTTARLVISECESCHEKCHSLS